MPTPTICAFPTAVAPSESDSAALTLFSRVPDSGGAAASRVIPVLQRLQSLLNLRGPHIVRLVARDRAAVLAHLIGLPETDRQCRFGAGCSDSGIARYVDRIDFQRDLVLAVFSADAEPQIVALAHVPLADGVAELGISVSAHARRRGLGVALARDAIKRVRRAGAREFRLNFASGNEGMRRLAIRLGISMQREGAEWSGRLPLAAST